MKSYNINKLKIDLGDRKLKLLIASPIKNKKDINMTPGVLWLHGGGYATGMAEMFYFTRAKALVKKYGAVVIMPNYRLSIKHPYPAALEDCYDALKYLKNNSEILEFNINKIFVGGESAGGGLTAALCMYARDKQEINIAYQMPLYPMLDYRDTDSSKDNHAPVWNTKRNHKAWKMYLKGVKDISPYASPSLQTNYTNLPPCYSYVGDIEPFYDETLTYIDNLKKAGVEANVDVYKNWFHAYDLYFPFTKKGKNAIQKFENKFVYAMNNYSANNYK